jgi:Zn-dependent peptidase ImmA (M78 family)/DNA-binding XRE family transcriptional regulator
MAVTQEDVALRLRAAREAAGLTQEEAGRRLGIARTAMVQLERGSRSVSGIELVGLARLYGRDIRSFVDDEEPKSRSIVALYRSFVEPGDTAATDALQSCLRIGRELTDLERAVGLDRRLAASVTYSPPQPRSRFDAIRQGAGVALQERQRLGIGDAPIRDMGEFLERQGVRTAELDLPKDVAGLMVVDDEIGPLVVVNRGEAFARRQFSFAHEYAHVILDADAGGLVSRDSSREELTEVRANAFAANFLLPEGGIRRYLSTVGKEGGSRLLVETPSDDNGVDVMEGRDAQPREIRLHDVVLLARHFGVSRQVVLYRLRNIGVLKETELQALLQQERAGHGRRLAALFDGGEPPPEPGGKRFATRLLGLAFEAVARNAISLEKFRELMELAPGCGDAAATWNELLPVVAGLKPDEHCSKALGFR